MIGITINLVILTLVGVLTAADIGVAVILSPAMAVGFMISGRLRAHVDGERVRIGILVVSSLAAVSLLVTSLTG